MQIISLAELQDKECMTNPSNLLLDLEFFVYIGFFCHTFLHPLFYTPNQRITELQDKEAVHFGCNSLHNIDKKRCTRLKSGALFTPSFLHSQHLQNLL